MQSGKSRKRYVFHRGSMTLCFVPMLILWSSVSAEESLVKRTWQVNGVVREGLVAIPNSQSESRLPIVFAFHGHGGNAAQAARSFGYHRLWPESVTVYLQGLPTPGRLTDPEGKRNGWQHDQGEQGDRDLAFFDEVLRQLKKECRIDENRIYVTGHSNGGGFTYLLLGTRGDLLAAVAPSAAIPPRSIRQSLALKPILHVAGEKDPLVKFSWQKMALEQIKKQNGCDSEGIVWGPDCKKYESSKNAPLVTMITTGDHQFPKEAPPIIVRFFKEHAKAHSD